MAIRENSMDGEVVVDRDEEMKSRSNYVVLGILASRQAVEHAVSALRANGFRSADISALIPSPETNKEFAHQAASKAPEGATTGATAGAAIGTTLGWLVGIGALAIPGVGPFIAAGPIMAALAGLGVGGAVGGITGGLIGFGIPEYEAKRYEGQIKAGGLLVSVHCDDSDWCDRAEEVLRQCGATDISTTRESSADYAQSKKPYNLNAPR